jgi:hypothetical protein
MLICVPGGTFRGLADSCCRARDALRPPKSRRASPRWLAPAGRTSKTGDRSPEMVAVVSGTLGAGLLAVGSHLIIPIGVEVGSLLSLLGIGSMMLSFGLADGE